MAGWKRTKERKGSGEGCPDHGAIGVNKAAGELKPRTTPTLLSVYFEQSNLVQCVIWCSLGRENKEVGWSDVISGYLRQQNISLLLVIALRKRKTMSAPTASNLVIFGRWRRQSDRMGKKWRIYYEVPKHSFFLRNSSRQVCPHCCHYRKQQIQQYVMQYAMWIWIRHGDT